MKKFLRLMISSLLVAVSAFGFIACSEMGGVGSMATAIGQGHGTPATIIEVTVSVDGAGMPKKVHFDEIMPVNYAMQTTRAVETGSIFEYVSAKNATTGAETKTKVYNVLYIDGIAFKADVTTGSNGVQTVKYKGSRNGTAIDDLATYCALADQGMQWYYDSFVNKKCFYGKENTDGTTSITTTAFTTTYGSMRKRYSTYWSKNSSISQFSGLGIQGNWDALENYLLAYGFDGISDEGAIVNPKDTTSGLYVEINGIQTGATLSADTGLYLKVAKAAYDKALENMRNA